TSKKWKSQAKTPAKRKNEGAPIRHDLVSRVRQEIAAGTYDTPEKFELALDKMLGELDLG
ncbi:MAG: flagellar biosynthesis anti-sigma factor FlgM, partial [Planctomycetes bacterium]|nr:flagellar biosynthesis anti-sigma factor FlgM [Planctomycetota bacterium]